MTLSEITYGILEVIRSNRIVDDEEIDLRLIKSWVKTKRADILKNKAASGCQLNLINAQSTSVTVTRVQTNFTAENVYPFTTANQDYYVYKSTLPVPNIIAVGSGPLILEITSSDGMKLPYSFGSYSRLRFAGNGRFNSTLIFGAIDVDKYLYLNDNAYLGVDSTIYIKAIFEDPESVPGFVEATSNYPCSLDVVEAIKASILDKEFKVSLAAPEDNNANDANDEN